MSCVCFRCFSSYAHTFTTLSSLIFIPPIPISLNLLPYSLSLSPYSLSFIFLQLLFLSLSLFHFIFGLLFSGACFFNDNNYHALSSRQVVVKLDHLPCSTSQSAMILVLGKCFVKKSSFGCSKLKLAESSITYIRRLKFYNLFTVLYCRYLYYKYRYQLLACLLVKRQRK